MRTVGQILKEAREAKLYSLEEIEKNTKIRIELLKALEADDYSKLPPETFVQGFIKNYGKFLSLDAAKLLAVFRRDYEARKHPPQILESFLNPLKENKFYLSPSRVLSFVVVTIVIMFFAYLWVEYRQFVGAPNLEVFSPNDQQTVEIPNILVEGKTDPEGKVTVNNQEIGLDKDGHFKEEIKLLTSTNKIVIVSTSKFGQSSRVERTVFIKR